MTEYSFDPIDARIEWLEQKLAAYKAAGWDEDLDHVEDQLAEARAERDARSTP